MPEDSALRLVLFVVLLAILPVGIYHRVKSQATGESLDRRQEGIFILATLRPLGAALWLGVIAWMINPAWMAWSSVRIPLWSRWAGVPILLAGAALLVWTFRSLGKNLTDTVVTRKQHTLISHGPYRWIRHPLYSSAALFVVALSLVAANWFFFVTGMVLLYLLVVRTRTEEANLIARFGDSYRQYMERTGRFVPRILLTIVFVALAWSRGPGVPILDAQRADEIPRFDVNAARAGNEEWQRIRNSAPLEWEGDLEAIAEWTLRNYGGFIEKYPDHSLAAEAMLNVATAVWAKGDYPELFRYIIAPTWEEHAAKERHLSQWFDTSGFGAGLGRPETPQPEAAAQARTLFISLAAKYPSSTSAVIARYYSAVILDYCLGDAPNALAEYQAFMKRHPAAPQASKAKKRIAALHR